MGEAVCVERQGTMTGFWGRNADGSSDEQNEAEKRGEDKAKAARKKMLDEYANAFVEGLPQTTITQGNWSVLRVRTGNVVHFKAVWNGREQVLISVGNGEVQFGINWDRRILPSWVLLHIAALIAAESSPVETAPCPQCGVMLAKSSRDDVRCPQCGEVNRPDDPRAKVPPGRY